MILRTMMGLISFSCSPTLRWWSCVDPPTHTSSTWTLSVCSPVWVCGCSYGCSAPCCWSEGSYSRPISSGQSEPDRWTTSPLLFLSLKSPKDIRGKKTRGWSHSGSYVVFSAERVDRIDILRPGGYGLGAGLFVLQGAGEEKTLAVAWNAKLSDVNETRFFWLSFLFEKCYFRGKTLFRGSFKPTAPPCGDHQ